MYYIDAYLKKLVDKKDPYSPPERYIEYREGLIDNEIKETYIMSYNPLKVADFIYSTYDERGTLSIRRNVFFQINELPDDLVLLAYTVPSRWYKEEIEKLKKEKQV